MSDHGLEYKEFHPIKAGITAPGPEHNDNGPPDAGLAKLSREMSVKARMAEQKKEARAAAARQGKMKHQRKHSLTDGWQNGSA